MARNHVGRHRAPGYNPLNEIADIATRSAQPAMKASAVVVASGGLVASFAIPASASQGADTAGSAAGTTAAAPQAVSGALSVAAPALDAAAAPTFGVLGFTATPAAKPAPAAVQITKIAPPAAAPAPAPVAAPAVAAPDAATTRASRTTTRTTPAAAAPAAAPAAVKPAAPAPAPAAPAPTGGITSIAASLSGIPYVYGGTTTRGFDCSGFTGYVYRLAGISIPRVASAQQAAATKVSNPVPGDLVFFGYPAYHVGIYAGPGMMYDAQHPGTVTGLHSIWTSSGVSYGRF
ncbi:MAG: C40 family peptidase [Actinomycetota bacterium]|nr:C40 family peptidase [Actinomycetota bacterium]